METIIIEMPEEEKDKLFDILNRLGLTVDQVTDIFLRWVIDNPDEAGRWLKSCAIDNKNPAITAMLDLQDELKGKSVMTGLDTEEAIMDLTKEIRRNGR